MTDDPPAIPSTVEQALRVVESWAVPHVAAAVRVGGEPVATIGPAHRSFRLASISKVVTAYAVLIAVEEGTVALDDPVGPEGCTLHHLLAHAGGLPFDGPKPVASVGVRRIYSNTGYDLIAEHVATRSGIAFCDYVTEAVLEPLDMQETDVSGSAAKGFRSTITDLDRFVGELIEPTLLARATWAAACEAQFPLLSGVVPGVGSFEVCSWGLGPELRGTKQPHWTGSLNSPATFGHFGGAGTFFWVDPQAEVAVAVLTDREFGDWALRAWPEFSDTVLASVSSRRPAVHTEGVTS